MKRYPTNSLSFSFGCTESMESPELPVFFTLDLKINKQVVSSSALPSSPQSPPCPQSPPAAATPELPTFETPFISKLISTKKVSLIQAFNT